MDEFSLPLSLMSLIMMCSPEHQRPTVLLGGRTQCAGYLIRGNPVSDEERLSQEWLASELLSEGLETHGQVSFRGVIFSFFFFLFSLILFFLLLSCGRLRSSSSGMHGVLFFAHANMAHRRTRSSNIFPHLWFACCTRILALVCWSLFVSCR